MGMKTDKDLRAMLAGTLELMESLVPAVNAAVIESGCLKVAFCESDAVRGRRLLDSIRQQSNASTEPVGLSLIQIQNWIRELKDDSLWNE